MCLCSCLSLFSLLYTASLVSFIIEMFVRVCFVLCNDDFMRGASVRGVQLCVVLVENMIGPLNGTVSLKNFAVGVVMFCEEKNLFFFLLSHIHVLPCKSP